MNMITRFKIFLKKYFINWLFKKIGEKIRDKFFLSLVIVVTAFITIIISMLLSNIGEEINGYYAGTINLREEKNNVISLHNANTSSISFNLHNYKQALRAMFTLKKLLIDIKALGDTDKRSINEKVNILDTLEPSNAIEYYDKTMRGNNSTIKVSKNVIDTSYKAIANKKRWKTRLDFLVISIQAIGLIFATFLAFAESSKKK